MEFDALIIKLFHRITQNQLNSCISKTKFNIFYSGKSGLSKIKQNFTDFDMFVNSFAKMYKNCIF